MLCLSTRDVFHICFPFREHQCSPPHAWESQCCRFSCAFLLQSCLEASLVTSEIRARAGPGSCSWEPWKGRSSKKGLWRVNLPDPLPSAVTDFGNRCVATCTVQALHSSFLDVIPICQLPSYLEQTKRRPCHFSAWIPFTLWLGCSLQCFLLGLVWQCSCCCTISCSRAASDWPNPCVCPEPHELKCGKSFLLFSLISTPVCLLQTHDDKHEPRWCQLQGSASKGTRAALTEQPLNEEDFVVLVLFH